MDPEDIHILGGRVSRGLDSMLKGHKELTSNDTGVSGPKVKKVKVKGQSAPRLTPALGQPRHQEALSSGARAGQAGFSLVF